MPSRVARARRRSFVAAAVIAAVGMLATLPLGPAAISPPAQAQAQETGPKLLLNTEHVDALFPVLEDGELVMYSKVDLPSGNGQVLEVDSLFYQLLDIPASRMTAPGPGPYAFLGDAGDELWVAPMTQDPSLIWPGWSSESSSLAGQIDPSQVQFHLRDVEGPGSLEIFQTDSFGGPLRNFSSEDPAFTTRTEPLNAHVHANWAFTELGHYTLTFEATVTTTSGDELSTGHVDFDWYVGPAPTELGLGSSPAAPGTDDEVELVAEVLPEAEPEILEDALADPAFEDIGGTVTFFIDGVEVGQAPVEDRQAILEVGTLDEGTHDVTASFEPDSLTAIIYDGSEAESVLEVTSEGGDNGDNGDNGHNGDNGGNGDDNGDNGDGDEEPPPPDVTECPVEVVLDVGHVDVAARLMNGNLRSEIKDETQGVANVAWRPLESVAFHVKPEGLTQVPDNANYSFLGSPGDDIWQIPQTQDPNLIWAGWNTESINYSQLSGGVTWTITDVSGPGDMFVYQTSPFGVPTVHFDTTAAMPQSLAMNTPTHAHGNWSFTAEGIYELEMTHTATLAGGGSVSSGGTLLIAVGDVDLGGLCPDGTAPPTQTGFFEEEPPDNGDQGTESDSEGDGIQPAADAAPVGVTDDPCPAPAAPAAVAPVAGDARADGEEPVEETAAPRDVVVLDSGHVDYSARIVDGQIVSEIKDDTVPGTISWRDPADVVFHLLPEAETQLPDDPTFDFIGAAGDSVWQIPQTQVPELLWLGWNTEEIAPGQIEGPVSWSLDSIDGPGEPLLYELDAFGQPLIRFSGPGQTYDVAIGVHAHGNWAFTAEGTYRLTFTHTATLTGGTEVSDTAVMTMLVGEGDPHALASQMSAPRATPVGFASPPEAAEDGGSAAEEPVAAAPAVDEDGCPTLPRTGLSAGQLLAWASFLLVVGAVLSLGAWRRRVRLGW